MQKKKLAKEAREYAKMRRRFMIEAQQKYAEQHALDEQTHMHHVLALSDKETEYLAVMAGPDGIELHAISPGESHFRIRLSAPKASELIDMLEEAADLAHSYRAAEFEEFCRSELAKQESSEDV